MMAFINVSKGLKERQEIYRIPYFAEAKKKAKSSKKRKILRNFWQFIKQNENAFSTIGAANDQGFQLLPFYSSIQQLI